MNKQVLEKFNLTNLMVEAYCRKEGKNINSAKVRKEIYRDLLDGKLVVEDGELVKKKVRTK